MRVFLSLVCAMFLAVSSLAGNPQSFEAAGGAFLYNSEAYVIKAAELHYPRIPRPYWEQRILQCKALGMNTVCLYVFWNAHEPRPDEFDFSGQNDLREFVRLCDKNDMKVILRPGPYVCAEWEMGGLPWWLLKKRDIRLREQDPYFMERVGKFQEAVAAQVSDLTIDKGGPIIMVQVENEYGSYGTDKPYVTAIRDMLRRNFGEDVLMFQCDWSSNFLNNGLDDLLWTMNFGTGADIDSQFAKLREVRPDSPLMCSEFWSGWFDKWGANHETRPSADMTAGIDEMLSKGISFSLYMTHGGTNWGHWAGANSPGYAPDVTSYDYDAPISESGQYTPKYWALRSVLSKYADVDSLPDVPATVKSVRVEPFDFEQVAPLFANLPQGHQSPDIRPMEEFDQGFGSILYRTSLPALPGGGTLAVVEPHDFAQVFVDGRYVGKLDRRLGDTELALPPVAAGARLDILVEAMGRINFGRAIKDYKGVTDRVTVSEPTAGQPVETDLKQWTVFLLPDLPEFYESMQFQPLKAVSHGREGRLPAGVYRGTFNIDEVGDTFLDFETWGKGLVYVNGHPLGRIWSIGPQQTLYLPGCWLRQGENEILVFDVVGPRQARSEGLKSPVLDKLQPESHSRNVEAPDLSVQKPAFTGEFAPGGGWQQVQLAEPARGRFFCLEALSPAAQGDVASVAELYLLDAGGNRISREAWKPLFADSQETAGNHTADKVFDLQESTYWSTEPQAPWPHMLVIDLGSEQAVTALQYLPRMETGAPGAIRGFRLYLLPAL